MSAEATSIFALGDFAFVSLQLLERRVADDVLIGNHLIVVVVAAATSPFRARQGNKKDRETERRSSCQLKEQSIRVTSS